MRSTLTALAITLCCLSSPTLRGAHSDQSLLLLLPFDEGRGHFAADNSDTLLEAELNNVSWAIGKFGTALHFSGTNSMLYLPPVKGLNGATSFTISLWTTWDNPAPRQYPNLLSSDNWSPGGIMLFVNNNTCAFRMGRPGVQAGVSGAQWQETSAPLLHTLPQNKWVHLAVTFDMPKITTYVDGKRIAEAMWNHPVESRGLRLGGWLNTTCHQGLMDDLRIYSNPLTPAEITTLAASGDRSDASYQIIKPDTLTEPVAAIFKTRHAQLEITTNGRAQSLKSTSSGRELLSLPAAMVTAEFEDGRRTTARSVTAEGNLLHFGFVRNLGTVTLSVTEHNDFLSFKIDSVKLPDLKKLTLFSLPVKYHDYAGSMANMLSDDTDGVCLRAYDLPLDMSLSGKILRVSVDNSKGFEGWRAGLAAGDKTSMRQMLQNMALDANVPVSRNAGPWAAASESARGSYLFADLQHAATDDWISVAQRGGFSTIHLHGWWEKLGHYDIRKAYFPQGIANMQNSAARIQQAGMSVGIHTLTACIQTDDPWVASEANQHFAVWNTYTLARDLGPADTVIYVNEPLSTRHDIVFTYSGNGNAIRLGNEIIQYTELSNTPPYAFKDCTRGAFKTTPAAHSAGTEAAYLLQRYMAFYPQPDSPLADELAACIGNVFKTCKLNQLYFDGSEGMMSRYGIDVMRHKIMRQLDGDPILEASCHGAHNWWFHSRLGAWDHPVWAAKLFQDDHVRVCSQYRKSDLLEVQMGWWAPRGPTPIARGHFLDEMEYFACKNMGIDGAMSIQGINVNSTPLPHYIENQFTLLGWYERLRLARYFDEATIRRIAIPGDEFRLRQESDGRWRFTPVSLTTHRVTASADAAHTTWEMHNPHKPQPLTLRLEALYTTEAKPDAPAKYLLSSAELTSFKPSGTASGVKLQIEPLTTATPHDGAVLRLAAANTTHFATTAWARAEINFPAPYRNLQEFGAFGLWVKGDNSGAILNLQIASPREHMAALSEHYIDIDFEGWRYITLLVRERDTVRIDECLWPYRGAGSHALFRTPLNMQHISRVALYLNKLPPQGNSTIEVSEIRALPVVSQKIDKPCVQINDSRYEIPCTLESGQFVELDPNSATLTLHSENGTPLSVQPIDPATLPLLQSGNNRITCSSGRAEITLASLGERFGTQRPHSEVAWQMLDREYEMTRVILKQTGAYTDHWHIAVRPDAQATIELELTGTMSNPVLKLGSQQLSFPVTLPQGSRLRCLDGKTWQLFDHTRKLISEGELPQPIAPLPAGHHPIHFTCTNPDNAHIKLTKLYH